MVDEKTDDKNNTPNQFSTIFLIFSTIFDKPVVLEIHVIAQFFSQKDASMKIASVPIKTLDGYDQGSKRDDQPKGEGNFTTITKR